MVKAIKFRKVARKMARGTSLQGRVDVSYARLVKVFGPPNSKGDGYKTDAEWIMKAGSHAVTIYNWKDGKNYLGRKGLPISRVRDWHIGGRAKAVVALVRNALG